MSKIEMPPPLTPTYFVGVLNFSDINGFATSHGRCPAWRTSAVFAFSDPVQAGHCLGAVCRVPNIKRALTIALQCGYTPRLGQLPSDGSIATMCRPGDMWACVVYRDDMVNRKIKNSMIEVKRIEYDPFVYVGFYNDVRTPHQDLTATDFDLVLTSSDTLFSLGSLSQIG